VFDSSSRVGSSFDIQFKGDLSGFDLAQVEVSAIGGLSNRLFLDSRTLLDGGRATESDQAARIDAALEAVFGKDAIQVVHIDAVVKDSLVKSGINLGDWQSPTSGQRS
jgi:hypothetical protein